MQPMVTLVILQLMSRKSFRMFKTHSYLVCKKIFKRLAKDQSDQFG